MRRAGSNQFKRRYHILGMQYADLDLIRYVAFVMGVFIVFGIPNAVYQHRAQLDRVMLITQAHAEARNWTQPELAPLPEREAMIRVIKQVWRKDWQTGVAIARCESGLRHDAFNAHNHDGSTDSGLFQVNSVHGIPQDDLMNPYANAGYAYSIYKEQGTNPWYSSEKCWGGEVN